MFCRYGAAYVAAIGLLAAPGAACAAPNVVFVLVDTLRADRLGTHGCDRAGISPAIDAFAAEAVVFEHGISVSNWTIPSVASLFTGAYPEAHGVTVDVDKVVDGGVRARGVVPGGFDTLAERFDDAGYTTCAFVRNGVINGTAGYRQGFDCFYLARGTRFGSRGSAAEVTVLATDWIDAHRDESFFLYLHYDDPHAPYAAAEPFRHRYLEPVEGVDATGTQQQVARLARGDTPNAQAYVKPLLQLYDGEVSYFDSEFGRLLAHLDTAGLADNTIVVLTSDHGEQFNEHGGFAHRHLWQENIHVPMIVRAPGIEPRRVSGWVEMFDLNPTVLELSHIEPAAGMSATSLVPFMTGAELPKTPVYAEHGSMKAWIDGPHKLLVHPDYPLADVEPRLYDLNADPGERADLSDSSREVLDRLVGDWFREHGAVAADAAYRGEVRPVSETDAEFLTELGYVDGE